MASKKKTPPKQPQTELVQTQSGRGRQREGASFPVSPSHAGMPKSYAATLQEIKQRIGAERLRVVLSANAAMVLLYWDIGRTILERQAKEGWGAKVIDRLSADLREAFADMKGLSARNLKYMRAFAEAWPDRAIVQGALAQITWYHNITLLEKLDSPEDRLWYARNVVEHGWSQPILCMQIEGGLHKRQGKAVNNFALALPPADSDMAAQVFKDPHLFDFIGIADPRREREVEQALVDHVQKFLLEMGAGFAFVGRQVHLEFSGADYYLDLLFYHLKLRCYVVVELKAVAFEPEFVGKLNMYMSAVDDLLRHADDKPTIGLLLCKGKDRIIAEYALNGYKRPIGVADWKKQLTESLPAELKGNLPTVEEIEAELGDLTRNEKPSQPHGKRGGLECREASARYGTGNIAIVPAPFEDSELGEIPKGWTVGCVGELAEASSGKRPDARFAERSDEASVPLWGGNGPMAFVRKPLVDEPILLTGRVGTLGSVFRITSPCWPSDNTLILRANESCAFEYLFLQLQQVNFASLNRGSTQPLLTQTDLKAQRLVVPTNMVLKHFSRIANALYCRFDESADGIRTLAALRDALLPKLISGELRVSDAERIVGRAV